jgi:hypothetical protein
MENEQKTGYALGGYSGKGGEGFIKLSQGYGLQEIMEIKDPEGGATIEMPTAVPSPFARFDLIKTAFQNIARSDALTAQASGSEVIASKDEERLVSYTLDLAEIIYNYATYKNDMKILRWDREEQIKILSEGGKSHDRLAKSLELYLNQDVEAYNFQKNMSIYLFKCKGKVIGSTSTVTLFCPSAARLSDLNIILPDSRIAFGDAYKPLYARDEGFQKWLYLLLAVFKEKGRFARDDDSKKEWLSGILGYYQKNRELLRKEKPEFYKTVPDIFTAKLPEAEKTFKSDYASTLGLNGLGDESAPVTILDYPLSVQKHTIDWSKSDFRINSSKFTEIPNVLVLQKGFTRSDFIYAKDNFKQTFVVPSQVPGSWKDEREMPGLGDIKGHYITVSDFLEPYLVRAVYPIHSERFFTASKPDANLKSYLLPLKKDFFEFFNVEDITGGSVPGKPELIIEPKDNGEVVDVMLKIPVKKNGGGYITLKRTYKEKNEEPNEKIEDGGIIVERRFGITIFPFVKPKGKVNVNYRVQLVDSNKNLPSSAYSLNFYAQSNVNKKLITDEPKHRMSKKSDLCTSDYYKLNGFYIQDHKFLTCNNEFDIIQLTVTNPLINALIIPNWPSFQQNSDAYTFAVDFGTTNTYIAYKVSEDSPAPFNIKNKEKDALIATLFDERNSKTEDNLKTFGAYDVMDFIDKEFVPRKIGRTDKEFTPGQIVFEFPQRTAIAYHKDMKKDEWENGCDALAESNIPFGYEKRTQKGDKVDTNIKWSESTDPFERIKKEEEMKAYLEQIMMLLQAKVLANGGSLEATRLIWFYPSSMTVSHKNRLEKLWRGHFSNYFNKGEEVDIDSSRLVAIRESLAPFYSQQNDAVNKGAVASLDIGGGTTDAAIFIDGKLKGNASFKFAGNALFGDGYGQRNARENGFVLTFEEFYKEQLKKNGGRIILDGLLEANKASDINAFFFSVENSIGYWTGEQVSPAAYSYSAKLESENRLKFLILYFYVALIYHIGQILKNIKTDDGNAVKLRYVMFSGTGSKILKTLTSTAYLTKFTKKVFEDMKLDSEHLEIRLVDCPKEATCNGGLMATEERVKKDMKASEQALQYTLTCIKGRELESVKYKDYMENSEAIKESLVEFHEFFFKLNQGNFKFGDYFGIEGKVTEHVKENYGKLLEKYVDDSIEKNRAVEDIKLEDDVSETPFFMPLKSIILDLSKKIFTGLQ